MKEIVTKAKKHCIGLLEKSRCESLPFHNSSHTMEVFENVKKIGTYQYLNLDNLEPVLLAALFHDTGNATVFTGHENFSVIKAIAFLNGLAYPLEKVNLVTECIKATKVPQDPKNHLENIICDADLFHLGSKSYISKNKLLRKEWALYQEIEYSDNEWIALNIKFLEQHRFFTNFGREILEPVKQKNIKKLKQYLAQV